MATQRDRARLARWGWRNLIGAALAVVFLVVTGLLDPGGHWAIVFLVWVRVATSVGHFVAARAYLAARRWGRGALMAVALAEVVEAVAGIIALNLVFLPESEGEDYITLALVCSILLLWAGWWGWLARNVRLEARAAVAATSHEDDE